MSAHDGAPRGAAAEGTGASAGLASSAVARLRRIAAPSAWGMAGPLLLVWLAAMLATPFVARAAGDAVPGAWLAGTVLLQAVVALVLATRAAGRCAAARIVAAVLVVSFAAEALGTATGFPFGAYEYTDLLGPRLLDVPLVIPFAWLMLLPSAWAVGRAIAGSWSGPRFVATSALALTAWDLMLDPQMVLWGAWAWEERGAYFGIPLQNFAGWLATAAAVTIVARPRDLPVAPLVGLYLLVALIEVGGLAMFWGLVGPAVIGGLAMGIAGLAALRRLS